MTLVEPENPHHLLRLRLSTADLFPCDRMSETVP
jgi:hypothetical protein